jgi:hypothetical protein
MKLQLVLAPNNTHKFNMEPKNCDKCHMPHFLIFSASVFD